MQNQVKSQITFDFSVGMQVLKTLTPLFHRKPVCGSPDLYTPKPFPKINYAKLATTDTRGFQLNSAWIMIWGENTVKV
ncbi:hypothetical protein ACX27_21590 [Nostoc piscinale CENA21]|uniref:Uncharacterized protein n=1 Tax=Nostoc piscinale CENA21 TaxID=224013 RepID=A0A0M3V656_9NOSO|nr:hypothetical protein ACX27_21590 [Nostoc piscinale CENA21]